MGGCAAQTRVDDLTALGMSLGQTIAELFEVDGILSSAADYGVYRQRDAKAAAARRAVSARGMPAAP